MWVLLFVITMEDSIALEDRIALGDQIALEDFGRNSYRGYARFDVSWIIETVVPWGFVTVSTRAPSCLASASTMIVPNPDVVLAGPRWACGVPMPLSETASRQPVSAVA